MTRRLHHARQAASQRRWHWNWRRLMVVMSCRPGPSGCRMDSWGIDVGYCLDRYMIGDEL